MLEIVDLIMQNLPATLLLIAGIVLVSVEMFMPGFGVLGITGIVCLLLGVVVGANNALEALVLVTAIIILLCVILFFAMRSAARGRISRTPLVLSDSTNSEAGFDSVERVDFLLGADGTTVSALRPAGIAEFGGKRYDVVSDSEFISGGEKVRVTQVEGRRIVVRLAREV